MSRSAIRSTVPMTSPERLRVTVPTTSPCLMGAATLSGRWKVFWVTELSLSDGRMVYILSAGYRRRVSAWVEYFTFTSVMAWPTSRALCSEKLSYTQSISLPVSYRAGRLVG